jgi:hypothetical protein
MRSRNAKGAKVLQGIAATGKIPQPAKFFNQQNLVAGGGKAEQPNFANRRKNWARRKKKEKAPRRWGKNLPPSKFASKTKKL